MQLPPYIQIVLLASIVSLPSLPSASADQGESLHSMNHCLPTFLEELAMQRNKDPSPMRHYAFGQGSRRFTPPEPDKERLALEDELRQRNKLYNANVQWLLDGVEHWSEADRQWAIERLREIIADDRIEDMRTGDPFRPLAPSQLLAAGDLHLLDQVDGVPWKIPWTALPRGLLVTGPQGAGKTRFIIWLCEQLNAANPPIGWFLIDPKLEFKNWANHLGALYIDADRPDVSIDLSPLPGLTYEAFLPSLTPQLGEILGVIYGIDILQRAAQICIELRHRYMSQANCATEICLEDLYRAVPLVEGASSWRRAGYRDAVLTGLSRILAGSGNLFKCRKGMDLDRLFERNVVFGARSITDDFATQFLAFYLLWRLHESGRYLPPTDRPKSVLIVDDSSRFIGARDSGNHRGLSSLGSVLTTLRSSGHCFVAVTQVPHLIDPGVCALMHTIVNIGGLHHAADTQLLAKMMGLSEPQRLALMSLGRREAVALCGGSAWPHPVHGVVAEVPDPVGTAPAQSMDIPELKTEPYENLFDLVHTPRPPQNRPQAVNAPPAPAPATPATPASSGPSPDLTAQEQILALDIVTFLTSTLRQRLERLSLSARQLESTKASLLNKGLIKEVWLGKSLMLAPMESLYKVLGVDCPYQRNASDVHSYLVLLAAKLLESDPLVKHVKTEVSFGDSSATADLVVYLKDGDRQAYEIVNRNTTNVPALAARLQGKGFAQICFLATEFSVKERVWATLRNAGFDSDFLATVHCNIFGTLLRDGPGRRASR
jgi:hypothetical protein